MSLRRFSARALWPLCLLLLAVPARAAEQTGDALLPSSQLLHGWTPAHTPLIYQADGLWQEIDGAAEQYVSFGCTSLTVMHYTRDGTQSGITAEIYRMKDELGSFGIYALERAADGKLLPLGAQGYEQPGEITFFGGLYYVKLRVFPPGVEELKTVHDLADLIAAQIEGSTFPKALDCFPKTGLVDGSLGFVPEGILSLEGLSRALVARYGPQTGELSLFWVREESERAAEKSYATVQAALAKRTTKPLEEVLVGGVKGLRAELPYQGPVELYRQGRDIVVAGNVKDRALAGTVLAELLRNIAAAP